MTVQEPPDSDRPVPLLDIWRLFRRHSLRVFLGGLIGAGLLGALAASRPVRYKAEATFRDQGNQANGIGNGGMLGIFTGALSKDNDATIPTLKSRKLWEPVVRRYQLNVQLKERSENNATLQRIQDNFAIEAAWWRSSTEPVLPDCPRDLTCQLLAFTSEVPTSLNLQFVDHVTFNVFRKEQLLGQGQINQPFHEKDVAFTIRAKPNLLLAGRSFSLSINPIHRTAEGLAKSLTTQPEEKSTSVLRLSFNFSDRQLASILLNDLMEEYRALREEENSVLADRQLTYLHQRQQDVTRDLENLILSYAEDLSEELPNSGIVDSQMELASLAKQKELWRSKLLNIELELQRLTRANSDPNVSYFETLGAITTLPPLVRDTIKQIAQLKQQRDRMELALRKQEEQRAKDLQEPFNQHMEQLKQIRTRLRQAQTLQHLLTTESILSPPEEVLTTNQGYIGLWYRKLYEMQHLLQTDKVTQQEQRTHFISYLANSIRLSHVHKHLLEERMSHQQNPSDELLGADLGSATNIYVRLNEQLDDTQALLRENSHLRKQLDNPRFEASTLSGKLNDPVSEQAIGRYSQLNMLLKNTDVRGEKDRERLTWEMDQQRAFLRTHLSQLSELLQLRSDFLNEKIWTALQIILDLVQQQVSLSEKHLDDYLKAHIEQLVREKELIANTMQDLNHEMAQLPRKWAAEQIIKQQSVTGSRVVEEVSRLVETKNIGHNLDVIQSGPLDNAATPIVPHPPYLALFTVLGAILGAGFTAGLTFVQGMWRGLPVSEQSLQLAGQSVIGQIPTQRKARRFRPDHKPQQKELVRRLLGVTCPAQTKGVVSIILGEGVDYSTVAGTLLSARGEHVLRLVVDTEDAKLPSLRDALEGKAAAESSEGFENLVLGGDLSTLVEELASTRFKDWLSTLLRRYDRVLLITRAQATEPLAEQLAFLATSIAVTVRGESFSQLGTYFNRSREDIAVAYLVCKT